MNDRKIRKAKGGFLPKLKKVLRRVPCARDALAMYYAMLDPAVPAPAKATIAAALVYFIVPIDLIPDFLIPVGFTDDAAVIALALATVKAYVDESHYGRANTWLESNA